MSDVDKMKLFGRNQDMDEDVEKPIKDNDVEKPIVTYQAKYIVVLSSNKSFPTEDDAYVYIYEDRVGVELLKSRSTNICRNYTDKIF